MDELDRVVSQWQADLDEHAAERAEARLRSWREPFNAREWAEGNRDRLRPDILKRSDGARFFYRGKVNELHGEPEHGKGWVAGLATAEVLGTGERVVWLDFDLDPEGVVERVLAGGATVEQLNRLFVHPIEEPIPMRSDNGVIRLDREGDDVLEIITSLPDLGLVVVDGINAAMALHGLSPREEVDVANFSRLLLWRLRSTGAAVLAIDHVVKDEASRGRFPSGSIHKTNVLDGASFVVKAIAQPGPGKVGRVKLIVAKDRHGGVRETATRQGSDDVAGIVVIDATGESPWVTLEPPGTDDWKPTFLMERISRWLEVQSEPVSQTRVEDEVRGKTKAVREALGCLVADGNVERWRDGQATLHRSVRPYREQE